MKCLGEVGLRIRNIRLDYIVGLIDIWIQDQFFYFSVIESQGILDIKYELKELQMNVYDMFCRVGLQMMNSIGGGLNSMSLF